MNNPYPKKLIKAAQFCARLFLDLLYPRRCPVCDRFLGNAAALSPDGKRTIDERFKHICPSCYASIMFFDNKAAGIRPFVLSLMEHDEASKKILYGLKYQNRRDNAEIAAYEAARRFHSDILSFAPDMIIPVPLHKKKKLARGFNQTELLSKRLAHFLKDYGADIEVSSGILLRERPTIPQKDLGPVERIANVKGAFVLSDKASLTRRLKPSPEEALSEEAQKGTASLIKGKKILLADDIYTTGATLKECAKILYEGGAKEVCCLTFSRVV